MQAGARHLPRAHDGGGRHTAPTAPASSALQARACGNYRAVAVAAARTWLPSRGREIETPVRQATPPPFVISLSPLAHCCLRWLRLRLAELHPPLSRVEAVLRNGKHTKCRVLSGGAGTRSWRHDFVTRRANSWRASQPPHSCRSAGKQPMALVSDLLQNEHWMVAQSGERQQRSGQGCA